MDELTEKVLGEQALELLFSRLNLRISASQSPLGVSLMVIASDQDQPARCVVSNTILFELNAPSAVLKVRT